LEILRLIRHFGTLKFDELQIFGLQLIDYRLFDVIVDKIERFRVARADSTTPYRLLRKEVLEQEVRAIYAAEIASGDTKTREQVGKDLKKFIDTKESNMRDYADACVRYLRATGMVNISHVGRSLSIVPERLEDVDYVLNTVDREPVFVNDEGQYVSYLGDVTQPTLLTDDKARLLNKFRREFPNALVDETQSITELQDYWDDLVLNRQQEIIHHEMIDVKDYKRYDDIQNQFTQILTDLHLYDAPLLLEWNTWRAMTMLDGGQIKANLKFDDFGKPMSTAQGNMSDIICDYGDFGVSVEVTMASGHKQYEMEGEPVTRHLAKLKKEMNKPSYCLFIAPKINDTVIAHFYVLHQLNVSAYGGKSTIIPLPLQLFMKMVEDSYRADYVPSPRQVKRFFDHVSELAEHSRDEMEWYDGIKQAALHWLKI
jgi:hypothetical protein